MTTSAARAAEAGACPAATKYGITHLPNSKCTRESSHVLARVDDIARVTCRDCLDEVARRGEDAVARTIELDRLAAEVNSGGDCPHEIAYACGGCARQRCTNCLCVLPKRESCVPGTCPDCVAFEKDLQVHAWPPRGPGGQHVAKTPAGVIVAHKDGIAAFSVDERSQHANRLKATMLLRAAMGRLPSEYFEPVVRVHNDDGWKNLLKGIGKPPHAPTFDPPSGPRVGVEDVPYYKRRDHECSACGSTTCDNFRCYGID